MAGILIEKRQSFRVVKSPKPGTTVVKADANAHKGSSGWTQPPDPLAAEGKIPEPNASVE